MILRPTATERFIAAEFIREKIMLLTKQEIPYASAVIVDLFKEDEEKNLIRISATITVEKESQKAIMIGKKGAMLKKIGTQARLADGKTFRCQGFSGTVCAGEEKTGQARTRCCRNSAY